ncbi:hypothetical protein G3578_09860 [Brevibacillus sp. SYP-B805]|uniref:hypothetical protein n=1 Tax=Brevibacillus sp. SYP-B805 TaxID=1578199 RepID=UPI0013EDF9DB|nr:hypothetical protein [Brevibacillus sp. SYP-B805]NGQ95458.1 hypothetical protein [Brevibacillus sp. SYP-B805]
MAQAIQREKKLTLAINVNKAEELPQTAVYIGMFLDTLDAEDEYDIDLHVGVNAPKEDEKPPIGFGTHAKGFEVVSDLVEIDLDDEEEPDGEPID